MLLLQWYFRKQSHFRQLSPHFPTICKKIPFLAIFGHFSPFVPAHRPPVDPTSVFIDKNLMLMAVILSFFLMKIWTVPCPRLSIWSLALFAEFSMLEKLVVRRAFDGLNIWPKSERVTIATWFMLTLTLTKPTEVFLSKIVYVSRLLKRFGLTIGPVLNLDLSGNGGWTENSSGSWHWGLLRH